MELNEKDLQVIIDSVLKKVEAAIDNSSNAEKVIQKEPMKMKVLSGNNDKWQSNASNLSFPAGVFDQVDEAIEAAYEAQKKWIKDYSKNDRGNIINAMRKAVIDQAEFFAEMVLNETKLGNFEDKVAKLILTTEKTPGVEILQTETFSGDDGLTYIEQTPFGVIGAVTPVTNPVDTIINNGIGMLAAGNSVIFNVHPSSKASCIKMIELLNNTIINAGGPKNLLTMVANPTLETVEQIANHKKIRLLVGTGGPGMVKSLLKSGKKAIGAGAGNPPVIVDETANIEKAAASIIEGASFDNNILCIAEKEVFVVDEVADDLIFELLNQGAYMLDKSQLQRVMQLTLKENKDNIPGGCTYQARDYLVNKEWVGKDASLILEKIGVTASNVKLLVCDVDENHPYVQLEQLMPILPIVRVKNVDEAIEQAVKCEHGNRHTAVIHSNHVENITRFAKEVETTIFVANGSSLAGVGYHGEGFATMTIAGPTGEGVTSARSFTRQRRTAITNGGLNIIG